MTNLSIKGALARLMATENLIVEHDSKADTASFNVDTRVLVLPVLQTNSEYVYNMFLGHEVGHALHTPRDFTNEIDSGLSHAIVNIVEDVRIEKLIQSKFPGLRGDFYKGYSELNDRDFFDIKDKNLEDLNLLDRINLHFKLRSFACVPFSDPELEIVKKVDSCVTFEDVIKVGKTIATFIDMLPTPDLSNTPLGGQQDPNASGPQGEGEGEGEGESGENDEEEGFEGEDLTTEQDTNPSAAAYGSRAPESQSGRPKPSEEIKSETQEAFDKSLKRELNKFFQSIEYITAPSLTDKDLDSLIIPLNKFRDSFPAPEDGIHPLSEEFRNFMKSIASDVSLMVQRFEQRKSADAYAKSTIHKTGVLNTQKLHNYKLSDDIFLRQTVLPDGKNHGMVMYLDWSGSMDHIAFSTVKQILILVEFCRKIQIPFEVYAFTTYNNDNTDIRSDLKKERAVSFERCYVVNVLSSSATKNQIDEDMLNIYSHSYRGTKGDICSRTYVPSSYLLPFGGTPLDNSLFLVEDIIRRFKKKTNAQKVSFVCLSDGDSAPLVYYKMRKGFGDKNDTIRPTAFCGQTAIIRSANGVTHQIESGHRSTGQIAQYLSEKMPDVSISNIFLANANNASKYLQHFEESLNSDIFKKEGSYGVTTKKYWPLVCVMSPAVFGDEVDEIEVADGARPAEIRSALKKYLKKKVSAKKLLLQMVDNFS